jgi:hypothetical protein
VTVGVIRDKKQQNINLTLPERKQSGDLFPEESFQAPDIDIDARAGLSEISTQIAKLRPEIELAVREAQRTAESFKKRACDEQKEQLQQMQKQRRELEKQMRDQSSKLQEQFNNEFKKDWQERGKELQRELRQLQQSAAEI